MRKTISKQARSTLLAATPSGRVPRDSSAAELFMAGLVSAQGNLTFEGAQERQAIARQAEDEAFGE